MRRSEQIPYGVKDFKRIRLENFYYVDKTAFIRKMEARANFLFFVRPRRFGKSLLCETLRCYYDVAEKENFERLFGDLDIGKNPTKNANRYFVPVARLLAGWDSSRRDVEGQVRIVCQHGSRQFD